MHLYTRSCDCINEYITNEAVYILLILEISKQLIIGYLYRPPSSDLDYMDSISSDLERTADSHKKGVLWIEGDLNLPDITCLSQRGAQILSLSTNDFSAMFIIVHLSKW